MNDKFNEMIENIENGNWTTAQSIFKELPFEMTPSEFTDKIKEIPVNMLEDIALVGFYSTCKDN